MRPETNKNNFVQFAAMDLSLFEDYVSGPIMRKLSTRLVGAFLICGEVWSQYYCTLFLYVR